MDHEFLSQLEDGGKFVIGYHNNSYERASFDREKALRIFEEDVAELRHRYSLDFFSPHGGIRDPQGKSNSSLPIPEALSESIRWVANGYTVRFDGYYSDGGINALKPKPEDRDLRDFVRTWQPGKRYRVLTHPQYYSRAWKPAPTLTGVPWYDSMTDFYAEGLSGTAWDDVELPKT